MVLNALTNLDQSDVLDPHQDEQSAADEEPPLQSFDQGLAVRNLSIIALVLGWAVSFSALALGSYLIATSPIEAPSYLVNRLVAVGITAYSWITPTEAGESNPYVNDQRILRVPEAVMFIGSLLLTFALTLLLDSLNFIHSTALRWALWREGVPMHNSNPRFLTYSKHDLSTSWPAAVVAGAGLVFAYGGISVLSFDVYIIAGLIVHGEDADFDPNVSGQRYGIDFNAWGLIGLGVGTLLQVIVATLCLLSRSNSIPTWTSNPIVTTQACRLIPQTCSDVVMATTLSRPRTKQRSLLSAFPRTRQITIAVWVLFGAQSVFVMVVAIVAKKLDTTNPKFVYDTGGRLDFLAYLQNFGSVTVRYNFNPYTEHREWVGLLIQSAVLAVVLTNIHLVEYITLLIRDEHIWRKATTRQGLNSSSGAFAQGASTWEYWFLFLAKSVVPWVFSYAFSCNVVVAMCLIPLAILAILFLILAVYVEAVIRWQPKGSQPSTYGCIPAILALTDDCSEDRVFWGHKHIVKDGIGQAGLAGSRLADVDSKLLYYGLRAEIKP